MKLFGEAEQETREEDQKTLYSWERALYNLGVQKAYAEHEKRLLFEQSGYRDNPLDLLSWPTDTDITRALEANAREHHAQDTEDPTQDLIEKLVPILNNRLHSYLSPQEKARLTGEHLIAVFQAKLEAFHSLASYYLSLNQTGQLAYANAASLADKHITAKQISQIAESPASLALNQWVRGLILRMAQAESTFYPSDSPDTPDKEPSAAELKVAINWINEPHLGIATNLPETIAAMKRYRLKTRQRGDTMKTFSLEQIDRITPPIQTLDNAQIAWPAWDFLPYPDTRTKTDVSRLFEDNPQVKATIVNRQQEDFSWRWLRAIVRRGYINTTFLQIDLSHQEITEKTIINPAKEDASQLASAIPELHLVTATEAAWRYSGYYQLTAVTPF